VKHVLFLWALAFFCGVSAHAEEGKALFVSVIQEPPVLESRKDIRRLVAFAEETNVKTLFVQIYRENKAWFPSAVADASPYEAAKAAVEEDPFARLVREAHAKGIEVHAWINLLSLSQNENAPLLREHGPAILTRNAEPKKTLADYRIDDQYFLEPGDPRVRETLLEIVGEIAHAYPEMDGLQFDYVRYPDWKPAYGRTEANEFRFRQATGVQTIDEQDPLWREWKRDQVTSLVRVLRAHALEINPRLRVSTTGLVPYSRAREEAFQDWALWVEEGLADFVTLMAYNISTPRFEEMIRDAERRIGSLSKVHVAVGAYTALKNPAVFEEQFRLAERSGARAPVVFHYGSLLENPALVEPLRETKKRTT